MIKKLFTQIYNERLSNIALILELLVVSVVLWFVIDALYVKYSVYTKPMGIDIEHTYMVKLGYIEPGVPGYHKYKDEGKERTGEVMEILDRIQHRHEVEAATLVAGNGVPYGLGEQTTVLTYDTISVPVISRLADPDYFRVFRIHGSRGETPEEMTEKMKNAVLMASEGALDKYSIDITSLIGKDGFGIFSNGQSLTLGGTYPMIRKNEYQDPNNKYSNSVIVHYSWSAVWGSGDPIVVRVKEKMDKNFIENLRADAENLRVGNIYISDVRSIADMRHKVLQKQNQETMMYLFGAGFLLLNIFLGLLGTFWFRTQQRRQEIALHKVNGASCADILGRLICEGLYLVAIATPLAMLIDFNIAHSELNAVYNGTTLEPLRFIICVAISAASIILMMIVGIYIPARKAMKIEPAVALHGE